MNRVTGNIGLLKPTTVSSTLTVTGAATLSSTLAVTGAITEGGNNVLTNLDTASLSTRIDAKLSPSDTVSLSSRIDGKVSLTGDQTINGIKTFGNQVNISGQITISGSVSGSNRLLGKNTSNNGVGDVTVGTGLNLSGSNVLTASGTDTTSLSDRINLKYNSSGGTISGAVTLSTTTATPTSLLGKDGSNVVGSVTTVAQTGLFGRGSVSNEITDANGNITVAHGFNFTPIMAFANLPGQTTNIINVKEVDGTNITFVVRDGATNDVRNTVTITKIEFFGIK
jgi:CRISPR-associated DxTHG motif protein